jgi:hypothetical protein
MAQVGGGAPDQCCGLAKQKHRSCHAPALPRCLAGVDEAQQQVLRGGGGVAVRSISTAHYWPAVAHDAQSAVCRQSAVHTQPPGASAAARCLLQVLAGHVE